MIRANLTLLLVLAACGGPDAPGEVPIEDAELLQWVSAGNYLDWEAEPEIHESDGPHFGAVLSFYNDELYESLVAREEEHPPAAAAVKELYGDGDEVQGWAVMVKVEKGDGGNTWYWWEYWKGVTEFDGIGVSACVGCHEAGVDHVLTRAAF